MTARDITGAESRILALILAHPQGIARSKIMAGADVTKSHYNAMASRLLAEGKINRTGSGPATRWGPPGIEKTPQKPKDERYLRDQRQRAEKRRSDARNAADAEAWAAAPVRQIVSREWQPMEKTTVASVWELAA